MDRKDRISNINILSEKLLSSPAELRARLPLTPKAEATVYEARRQIRDILDRRSFRLLAIVGPCSIHNVDSALTYARRLKRLADKVANSLMIVMRVYFEKPRSVTGWKGFINDPHLDDSFRVEEGLYQARRLLLRLAEMGLPAATEALDPVVPQYLSDLIAWTAIGARTTESQTHRELASGISSPVGFKNSTDGNIELAVNAVRSTRLPHHFLGITSEGRVAVFHTRGNRYAHVVLRGGLRPNDDRASVAYTEALLRQAALPQHILIDCSHGNSERNPDRQPLVLQNIIHQIQEGNRSIIGFMLESNLQGGRQDIPAHRPKVIKPGLSVTDPCLDWPTTQRVVRFAAQALRTVLPLRWRQRRRDRRR